MHADELAGAVGLRPQPGDRDRGRVRGDYRVCVQILAQVLENLFFDLFVLGRRLDHQLATLEALVILAGGDPIQGLFLVVFGNLLAGDPAVHALFDAAFGFFDDIGIGVHQVHVKPGDGAYVGNALTHLAAADDADLFKIHSHFSTF